MVLEILLYNQTKVQKILIKPNIWRPFENIDLLGISSPLTKFFPSPSVL